MGFNQQSRTFNAAKNFFWSTIAIFANIVIGFASRTVFIITLGTIYNGINSLFLNILGILSFAELGIGSAIGFSLYKPLAENDHAKIKAYIDFYKVAYRIVAIVVTVIGVLIIPFLKILTKGAESIDNLTLIYCIYLFNSVSSYLITYKTTILTADQRDYILTRINTIFNVFMIFLQIVVLITFKNFIVYLVCNLVVQLANRIYLNLYTNKKYPYLKEKSNIALTKDEKSVLFTKIKAMIFHKVGDISINQTDNIITSSFISVVTVGLVSNFALIINYVNQFISAFFSAATAGLGNIIATEKEEKRYEIFKGYDFLAFWFYGLSFICLYFLLTPFIVIWIGEDKIVDSLTVFLLCLNYYLTGMRIPLGNIKSAAGLYEPDKYCPIIQSVINIIVSVVGAIYIGLPGIYIGTLISSMVPNIIRPIIVYKYVFMVNVKHYFYEYIKRILILALSFFVTHFMMEIVSISNIYVSFIIKAVTCFCLTNIIFFVAYRKNEEFKYVISLVKRFIKGRKQ